MASQKKRASCVRLIRSMSILHYVKEEEEEEDEGKRRNIEKRRKTDHVLLSPKESDRERERERERRHVKLEIGSKDVIAIGQ